VFGESWAIPLWALTVICVFAAIGITDRIALPLIRMYLEHRRERAVDALNGRLALPIAPFKLAGRRALVTQLMLDPAVQSAIAIEAKETGESVRRVEQRARRYAREIVPSFNAALYFRVGTRLARKLSTALYRVRVGASDMEALKGLDPNASVVFVINHRSNMDYVLVTYLASRSSALSYAVGEWARLPGLASLIRSMGAYFIRRGSGNLLYRRVLARYVHIATASGVTQAIFPEGGLSRDGRLQPTRLGLLSYMVDDFDPLGPRDIVFVPVGLNYDRVLEDRVLLGAAQNQAAGARPRFSFRITTFAGFVLRMVTGRLLGRWYRNGYACVCFGAPMSLRGHMKQRQLDIRGLDEARRKEVVAHLGATLMRGVGRTIPALPVSLVAVALVRTKGKPLSTLDLKLGVARVISDLKGAGGYIYLPRADEEYAVDVGLRLMKMRHMINDEAGALSIAKGQESVVQYYANSITHLLAHDAATVGGAPVMQLA
jgi:glycerol-3-phosphate O-acyltransferase